MMPKSFSDIFIVGIIAAVVLIGAGIGGYFVFVKKTSSPQVNSGQMERGIELVVDKKVYRRGDQVKITLKNNSGATLEYTPVSTCGGINGEWWKMEKWDAEKNVWQTNVVSCRIRQLECDQRPAEPLPPVQVRNGTTLTDFYASEAFCVLHAYQDEYSGTVRIHARFSEKDYYSPSFEIQ